MPSNEFWFDDPELFNSYRRAYMNKEKREMEVENYSSWLLGLYIHHGNSLLNERLVVSISKMLGDKTSKPSKETYPTKPYDFPEGEEKKVAGSKEYKEFEKGLLSQATMKKQYLEKIKKKGGE